MYLGTGSQLEWNGYSIKSTSPDGRIVKASLSFDTPSGKFSGFSYSSDTEVSMSFVYTNNLKIPSKKLMVYYKTANGVFPVQSVVTRLEKGSPDKMVI